VLAFVARRVQSERVAFLFALREPTDLGMLEGLPVQILTGLGNDEALAEISTSTARGDGNGAVDSVLLLVIVIASGLYIRARRQLVASLRERADKTEAEQQLRTT
jgi:hypothetical protein